MNGFYNAVSTIVTPRVIRKKKEEVVFDCPAIDPSKDITEVSKEEVAEKQEIEAEEASENTQSEVSESKQQEEADLAVANKRSRTKKQKNE